MPALDNFRANLKAICRQRKLTQRELAEKAGVHYVTVNRIFQGILEPSIPMAERLVEAAGADMKKIFSEPS